MVSGCDDFRTSCGQQQLDPKNIRRPRTASCYGHSIARILLGEAGRRLENKRNIIRKLHSISSAHVPIRVVQDPSANTEPSAQQIILDKFGAHASNPC